jgi:hypothetical protein
MTMALVFAPHPEEDPELVRERLRRIARRKNPLSGVVDDVETLEIDRPHTVWDLRADAVARGEGIASATPAGTRYLIADAGAAVAAAEVTHDGPAGQVHAVNYGPHVSATEHALADLATPLAAGGGDHEVRLLRFAAIYLVAVWLVARGVGADVFYVLPPAPGGLVAEHRYSVDELFEAIVPLARERAPQG